MDGYLVGSFPPPWVEWNDRYRDTVRDFWRAGAGGVRDLASRLAGSSDLYADDGRSPYASVNFVTAHDGFTLRDLVSYDRKHNEANGEDNRDGTDNNRSWNHGVEGETDDPEVLALRRRQAREPDGDALPLQRRRRCSPPATSAAAPSGGNNNAYCQDNEISWVDWRPDDAWLDLYELTKAALRLRREHPALRQRHHFRGSPTIEGGPKDLAWLHPEGREMTEPDWYDDRLHVVGMFVSGDPLRSPGPRGEQLRDRSFLLWLNAQGEPLRRAAARERLGRPRARWCSPPTPTWPVGDQVKAGTRLTLGARSLVLLREELSSGRRPPRPRSGGGQRDQAELGGRGQVRVARHDADRVAERRRCVLERDARRRTGAGWPRRTPPASATVAADVDEVVAPPGPGRAATCTSTSSGDSVAQRHEGVHRHRGADLGGVADAGRVDVVDAHVGPRRRRPRCFQVGELLGAGVACR